MATEESQPQQNPQASGQGWTAFIKSIASFNGDLSSLTAPPWILSSTSLTEFSSYWGEHPAVLAAPAKEPDAKKRALLVLKWFLTTLKQQYASRSEKYGNEKKPLNPFLGEFFVGRWEDEAGTTELISEQGFNAQKASFSKTINIRQLGHALLTVPNPSNAAAPDQYVITLPSLHVEGLIFGSPYIELDGASYITSTTGYTAKIDYSGKGWISGKKNSFTAALFESGKEKDKEALYNVSGQWTKSFEIHEGDVKHNTPANLVDSWDPSQNPISQLIVAPIEQQHPLESRRAWTGVAKGIASGDTETAGKEKTKIEQAQRAMRKRELEEKRVWKRRYFTAIPLGDGNDDPILPILAQLGHPNGDADKTGGFWRFDAAKLKAAQDEKLSEEERARLATELLGQ